MYKSFLIISITLLIASCGNNATKNNEHKYNYPSYIDSLLYKNQIYPDTTNNLAIVFLPTIFCEPCKGDVSEFLNSLLVKINGLPKNNFLIVTNKMRKKEIPYFFLNDYRVNSWDTLKICMSDELAKRTYQDYNLIGAFLIVYDSYGKLVYKKQFKQFISYYDDIDEVAAIIKK